MRSAPGGGFHQAIAIGVVPPLAAEIFGLGDEGLNGGGYRSAAFCHLLGNGGGDDGRGERGSAFLAIAAPRKRDRR